MSQRADVIPAFLLRNWPAVSSCWYLWLKKINTGRTSIPCDWVIDRREPVVLPVDWAIDSGRGFALGFDWSRSSGSSWEAAECLSRQMRADVSSPLSCNHLLSSQCAASSLRPVFVVCAHMHKRTQYTFSTQSWKHDCSLLWNNCSCARGPDAEINLLCRSSALLTSLFGFSGSQTASLT